MIAKMSCMLSVREMPMYVMSCDRKEEVAETQELLARWGRGGGLQLNDALCNYRAEWMALD